MISIVNYGLGNIQAFVDIYKRLNIPVAVVQSKEELLGAEKIILPGVGAFDWAMHKLNESGMREALDELVLHRRLPVLGVCVGMQMMARASDEGVLDGLAWINAHVKKFEAVRNGRSVDLPHMGWNDVIPTSIDCLFNNMESCRFYFLHSYHVCPDNSELALATTDYHGAFTASVRHANIFGTQFHPEKSHHWGVQLLKNFAEL